MRSLKIDRKPSRSRGGKPKRGATRSTRAQAAQAPRRKAPSDNIVARSWRAVGAWFSFRRPILILTAALLFVVLIAGLFVGGYIGRTIHRVDDAYDALITDAGFGISEVHLAGNNRTPAASILAALGFEPGQSIFDADIQAARARLIRLDWVSDAIVRRQYPDDISVQLIEKLPFALWQAPDGEFWVVERNGRPITNKDLTSFAHLPVLIGAGGSSGADIVDAVAAHRAVAARIKAYQRISERRWNLILDDDVVVKLPEANWPKELDALERLIIDKGILERDVSEIDLRSPTQYFFVLKSGEKKNEPRGNAA
ncbi:MAG TPA: cell division protein FtsQ/DivIB [Rhizomicrobium sp.]|nr:cell division protein FtsQ/DivIB [Rhizomicrobium sp.]